jgi:hypothetical protein
MAKKGVGKERKKERKKEMILELGNISETYFVCLHLLRYL